MFRSFIEREVNTSTPPPLYRQRLGITYNVSNFDPEPTPTIPTTPTTSPSTPTTPLPVQSPSTTPDTNSDDSFQPRRLFVDSDEDTENDTDTDIGEDEDDQDTDQDTEDDQDTDQDTDTDTPDSAAALAIMGGIHHAATDPSSPAQHDPQINDPTALENISRELFDL